MMIRGIDVSSHQGQVDWPAVAAAGYAFAIVKATGGDQYANPHFADQFAGAQAAGLAVGIYHFDGEPSVHTGTPQEEAAWFLAHLPNPLPAGTLLALDAEETATRDVDRYLAWLKIVQAATGVTPLFYTYPNFINEASGQRWADLSDYPLWYAWYPTNVGDITQKSLPSAPAGWPRVTIWQYSGGSTVPGTSFPTDLNRFDGSVSDLRALGKAGTLTTDTTPPANDNPGFDHALQPDGRTVLNGVDFGGTAVTVEEVTVQVRNAAGERYTRRWVGYALEPWQRLDAPQPAPTPAPQPDPTPAPTPVPGGTMQLHDHGDIPLARPEAAGGQVVDPASGYLAEVFADIHQDYALAIWWQPRGWLPAIKYQTLIPGRWLMSVALVIHEEHLKVRLVHCPPDQTADLRDAWLDLGAVTAL